MNDRELLSRAAKAAGYDYKPANGAIVVDGIPGRWDPLSDDGDALRLAVQLRILVESCAFQSYACARVDSKRVYVTEPHDGDVFASTRRAIVRAAAALAPEVA